MYTNDDDGEGNITPLLPSSFQFKCFYRRGIKTNEAAQYKYVVLEENNKSYQSTSYGLYNVINDITYL
jgi:hypothetical protein